MTSSKVWPVLAAALLCVAGLSVCDREGTEVIVSSEGGAGVGSGATAVPASDATRRPRADEAPPPPRAIVDHGDPAPTLYFVAGLQGYTEPCGCTAGLKVGGLDRVVGFIESARTVQPASLVVDAGNLLFADPDLPARLEAQERRKAELMLAAHARLGTVSTTPGPFDLALGVDYYRSLLAGSEITVLVANLSDASGTPLGPGSLVRALGDLRIGLIGAVDPTLFEGRDDVIATPPVPAVLAAAEALEAEGVSTLVLVMQGDLEATSAVLAAVPALDFALVGYAPAETDEVVLVDGRPVLQAYDQGRYVGILKLYPDAAGAYVDARVEDRAALGRVDRRLAYLRGQLALLPPDPFGDEPEIVATMRQQLDELEREREALRNNNLAFPDDVGAFVYWPVALEPGYPEDPATTADMAAYNAALRELNADATAIVPLGPSDVAYVGAVVCASCHQPAVDLWRGTPHSWAIETLEARDKAFDESCVGCHVTGFRQPGGAVTANHNGLANVQCEACHGAGGAHVLDPDHGQILRVTPATTCMGCHNAEHSPTFAHDRYLPFVLGPGHGG